MAEAVLIAAQSGRALAQAARRAGFRAYVADLFGDADTLELAEAHRPLSGAFGAGLGEAAVLAALDVLADAAGRHRGVVLGSGFEDAPALMSAIDRRHGLVGAAPAAVAALKDPVGLAALCARLGVPHPAISTGPVADPAAWLVKRAGGSGGGHVRAAGGGLVPPGHYLQARVPGRPYGMSFLADASGVQVLALTEQWCAPAPDRPYRYGGALAHAPGEPPALPAPVVGAVTEAVAQLVAATGLRGLASADFLCDGSAWWLTEINPRPGATLDLIDRRTVPLLAAHTEASHGGRAEIGTPAADAAAAGICYADRDLAPVPALAWPDHVHDRPRPGSAVRRDAPLCTVLATGADGRAAGAALAARTARLRAALNREPEHERRGSPA